MAWSRARCGPAVCGRCCRVRCCAAGPRADQETGVVDHASSSLRKFRPAASEGRRDLVSGHALPMAALGAKYPGCAPARERVLARRAAGTRPRSRVHAHVGKDRRTSSGARGRLPEARVAPVLNRGEDMLEYELQAAPGWAWGRFVDISSGSRRAARRKHPLYGNGATRVELARRRH